jgi:hypothetical protein
LLSVSQTIRALEAARGIDDGATHDLEEHLRTAALVAGSFAEAWGASETAALAALWHDLGKYAAEFQAHDEITGVWIVMDEGDAGETRGTESLQTRRWSKPDSNSRSHLAVLGAVGRVERGRSMFGCKHPATVW